jgi:hypothetical protein
LCTTDHCDDRSGCVNNPVNCRDGDDCTADLCDPATGECSYPPDDGRGCRVSEDVTGWPYGHFLGVCEGYACTGQPCDIQSTEEYPCPVPVSDPIWRTYVCCPLPTDHVGKPYCAIDETCEELVWGPLCEEICPNTPSNFVRQMMCVRAHGDCALVDRCEAECPRDQWECVWNDGVCPQR